MATQKDSKRMSDNIPFTLGESLRAAADAKDGANWARGACCAEDEANWARGACCAEDEANWARGACCEED